MIRVPVRHDVNGAIIVCPQHFRTVVLVSLNHFGRREAKAIQVTQRNHRNRRTDRFDESDARGGVAAVMGHLDKSEYGEIETLGAQSSYSVCQSRDASVPGEQQAGASD